MQRVYKGTRCVSRWCVYGLTEGITSAQSRLCRLVGHCRATEMLCLSTSPIAKATCYSSLWTMHSYKCVICCGNWFQWGYGYVSNVPS